MAHIIPLSKFFESSISNKIDKLVEKPYSLKYWDDVISIIEDLDLSSEWKIKTGYIIIDTDDGEPSIYDSITLEDHDQIELDNFVQEISNNDISNFSKFIKIDGSYPNSSDSEADYYDEVFPVSLEYIQNEISTFEKQLEEKIAIPKAITRIMRLDSGIVILKYELQYYVIFSDAIENFNKSKNG